MHAARVTINDMHVIKKIQVSINLRTRLHRINSSLACESLNKVYNIVTGTPTLKTKAAGSTNKLHKAVVLAPIFYTQVKFAHKRIECMTSRHVLDYYWLRSLTALLDNVVLDNIRRLGFCYLTWMTTVIKP